MKTVLAVALAVAALVVPAVAEAHPHIWIQQVVRAIAKDGKYTHVEIEWRFDPFSSEIEIPLIDEDKDGKFSAREIKALEGDMMPEQPTGPRPKGPRNLVYVMRFDLPQPSKVFSITTFDPDDFIRIEVKKDQIPAGCALAKSTTYKAEFVRGYPVFADTVTCQLP